MSAGAFTMPPDLVLLGILIAAALYLWLAATKRRKHRQTAEHTAHPRHHKKHAK